MFIKHKRPAIAMIELIFAIVIMGIVMMSAPMLVSTAAKSSSVALQQEGINEAVSRVSMILTYEWDESDTNITCAPPVLHVPNGDSELDIASDNRRIGVPFDSNSRTFLCATDEFNATALGSGGGDEDDIDDFADTTLVEDISGTGGQNYIDQTVNIATSISYLDDNASYSSSSFSYAPAGSAGITNIKEIAVTLTSTSGVDELSKTIILRAFSCNIGGYEFESREMP